MKEIKNAPEFNSIIAQDKPILLDFYADWCGPCQAGAWKKKDRFPISNCAPFFRDIIDNLIAELTHPGVAHRVMLETYLRFFLIRALRIWGERRDANPEEKTNHLAADFIALVEKHFRQLHAVADYAERLFVSPKSLAKRFKILGYPTPMEIIQDRIVLQAKRELRYTRKTVKEIAYDLGYDDPAYFSRLFAKKEGVSPVGYREG